MADTLMRKFTYSLLPVMLLVSPAISEADFGSTLIAEYNRQSIPASLMDSISVDFDRLAFGEALKIIADKGNFKLNYNRNRIPVNHSVTLEVEHAPAFEILFGLLQQTKTTLIVTPDEELAVVPARRVFNASLSGQVLNSETKKPLIGTNISILGTTIGCVSDSAGYFNLSKAPEGFQILQFKYIGYKIRKVVSYLSNTNKAPPLTIELEPQQILLQEITVTPGLFSVMGQGPVMRQTLTHEDMQNITFGEDVYRALTRLPGVTANDFSAKFTLRGGENEEILVLLDGLEIYEPFHLKDLAGGAFSFIDVGVIEGVELLTGGFPAEYGTRMSGVLNMRTIRPPIGSNQLSVGLSMMNAFFRSSGTFNGTEGAWFLSARRGFLDILLDIMDAGREIPRPAFYDLHAKLDYQLDRTRQISLHVLHAEDHSEYVDYDEFHKYERKVGETDFGNTYGWMNYRAKPLPDLYSQTVMSYGQLRRHRWGESMNSSETERFSLLDRKDARVFSLRQNWAYQYSDNMHLKGGFSIQHHKADYDFDLYQAEEITSDDDSVSIWEKTIRTILHPRGYSYSAHLADRFRIIDPLVIEVGLRFDAVEYSRSNKLSPRFNLVWTPADQTFLRFGWGHFYQNSGIHDIRVEDGEDHFLPPDMAQHWVAGFEHTYNNGINVRLEAYYKSRSQPRPDYRNGSNRIQFPELEDDRYQLNLKSALYKGLELYLKYDRGGRFSWWTSYALSFFSDKVRNVVYRDSVYTQGFTTHPNLYDQRHTFYLDLNYRTGSRWHVNLAYQFHTGLPYFDLEEFLVILPDGSIDLGQDFSRYNRDNYDPYSRVDLRINRKFQLGTGLLTVYLQVINLFNNKNLRTIEYDDVEGPSGQRRIISDKEYWFPLLPSIGLSWEWHP
ncbi:MAG: TonB-dependent receptor [Fidelibacterota bacterium]|nr:MAG: TonB-dependent receptor [Candidatus Neomarinimicrobiota bacterium]